jgi:hypothetical protein
MTAVPITDLPSQVRRRLQAATAPGKPKETLGASWPQASRKRAPQARDMAAAAAGTSGRTVGRWRCHVCAAVFTTWVSCERHSDATGHGRIELVLVAAHQ